MLIPEILVYIAVYLFLGYVFSITLGDASNSSEKDLVITLFYPILMIIFLVTLIIRVIYQAYIGFVNILRSLFK